MLQLCASSLADTHAIAGMVASLARAGDVVLLAGDMGAGKTAFAQGFGSALGVTEPVTSPTFTLVHSYDCGKLTLHHADLYRLERTSEVADLALGELAEFGGIVLVEWGDIVDDGFGDHLVVTLERDDDPLDDPADDPADGPDSTGHDDPAGGAADHPADGAATDDCRRRIELVGVGPSWSARWSELSARCEAYRC